MTTRILFIGLAMMAYTAIIAQNTDVSYGNNPKAGKYINIRGLKMYYEIYGSGEPLLIIHGNGGSIHDFTYQVPFFEKDYKVILADSRAQGKSADPGDSLSYEMMADDFDALLDALQLDSCYVIGWSDGGINGLLLAMRHPEKVKKLAITGANLWPDTTAVDPYAWNWAMIFNDSLNRMPLTPEVKNMRKLFRLLSHEPNIQPSQLKSVQCPTLVIGGDHEIIRTEHTLLIAQSIPKSYLWIVPNSGHGVPVVYKEIFNQTVFDFFKKPYRRIEKLERFQ